MCQLFALNSNTPSAATFSFTGLSARGGATGDHVDGFGLAFLSAAGLDWNDTAAFAGVNMLAGVAVLAATEVLTQRRQLAGGRVDAVAERGGGPSGRQLVLLAAPVQRRRQRRGLTGWSFSAM